MENNLRVVKPVISREPGEQTNLKNEEIEVLKKEILGLKGMLTARGEQVELLEKLLGDQEERANKFNSRLKELRRENKLLNEFIKSSLKKNSIEILIKGLSQLKEDYEENYKNNPVYNKDFLYLDTLAEDLNRLLNIYDESIDFYISLKNRLRESENEN